MFRIKQCAGSVHAGVQLPRAALRCWAPAAARPRLFAAAAGGPPPGTSNRPCIYEKLGGKEAVAAAVDIFYNKVLADERIKHFFDKVDMKKQRAKQMMFMMYAFGGPEEYKGRNMYDAHHGLHLTDEHFNAVAECFVSTLKELGVESDLIDDAVKVVATTHDDVVGH